MNTQEHKPNGSGAPQSVQINPQETAQMALMFLGRCDLKPAERQAFAHVEMLLQAIAGGQATVAQAVPPILADSARPEVVRER